MQPEIANFSHAKRLNRQVRPGKPLTAPASKLSDFLSGSAGQRDAET
jgi:hypothetical protein